MSGHRPFSELTKHYTPEQRREIDKIKQDMLDQMRAYQGHRDDLRRARALAQQDVAQELTISEEAVCLLEQQADAYVNFLRARIERIGGELNLVLSFPDCEVPIDYLSEVGAGDDEVVID